MTFAPLEKKGLVTSSWPKYSSHSATVFWSASHRSVIPICHACDQKSGPWDPSLYSAMPVPGTYLTFHLASHRLTIVVSSAKYGSSHLKYRFETILWIYLIRVSDKPTRPHEQRHSSIHPLLTILPLFGTMCTLTEIARPVNVPPRTFPWCLRVSSNSWSILERSWG